MAATEMDTITRGHAENDPSTHNIKLVVAGEDCQGLKRALLLSYMHQQLPAIDSIPDVFIPTVLNLSVNRSNVNLALLDTPPGYDRLQPTDYKNVTVFVLVYSKLDPLSYEKIRSVWVADIQHFFLNVPYIIVAEKIDTRDEAALSTDSDAQYAQNLGASAYCEFSLSSLDSIQTVFAKAIKVGFNAIQNPPKPDAYYWHSSWDLRPYLYASVEPIENDTISSAALAPNEALIIPPQQHDFQQEIDEVLNLESSVFRTELAELLVFISTHPSVLSATAWARLQPYYETAFLEYDAADNALLMATQAVKNILTQNPELNSYFSTWVHHLFVNLRQKIKADIDKKVWNGIVLFLQDTLYVHIKRLLGNDCVESVDCIALVATIIEHIEPEKLDQVLLCHAVAVSLYNDPEQKQRKAAALYAMANRALDQRVRDWQQGTHSKFVDNYSNRWLVEFETLVKDANPQKTLVHLAKLIHFLSQQNNLYANSETAESKMARILSSTWLIREFSTTVDRPDDFVHNSFRALWLRLKILKAEAHLEQKETIATLRLLLQLLAWVRIQALGHQHLSLTQGRRYLTHLMHLAQGEVFQIGKEPESIISLTTEEKEHIAKSVTYYWPDRTTECTQLNQVTLSRAAFFWDNLCADIGCEIIPVWCKAPLEVIIPTLTQSLNENRQLSKISTNETEPSRDGILIRYNEFARLKEDSLKQLFNHVEDLWQASLQRMALCAPCSHALLLLGSWARDEPTLYSDLELLLIIGPGQYGIEVFKASLHSGEIQSYFEQCFDLFSLQISLLGEGQSAIFTKNINYRLGLHLDDLLLPFNGSESFFGEPHHLAQYFALGPSSSNLKWSQYLIQTKIATTLQGESLPDHRPALATEGSRSILAAAASYDARFLCGDFALCNDYLKQRQRIMSAEVGLDGYSSNAVLAVLFCQARVLGAKWIFKQKFGAKTDLLNRISDTIKTLAIYHGIEELDGSAGMQTQHRCQKLLALGIISAELGDYFKVIHHFCDRLRTLSYAHYDTQNEEWLLFGQSKEAEAPLWRLYPTIWKEVIVMLHEIIYPLYEAMSDWCQSVLTEEFKPGIRPLSLTPALLVRFKKVLSAEGTALADQLSSVVYAMLMHNAGNVFLKRFSKEWWNFLLIAVQQLSPAELHALWIDSFTQLSPLEREQWVDGWDNLTADPQKLYRQHPYLTATEITNLCGITQAFTQTLRNVNFADGWTLSAHRKQKQWQEAVAALFINRQPLNPADLDSMAIQKNSVVIGCRNPYLSTTQLQQNTKDCGLFVLDSSVQRALVDAEKHAFAEALGHPEGKRHVVLPFQHTIAGQTHHFYLKIFPENPGMEYAMTQLQYILGGSELPDVWLCKIYTSSYPDGIAALLMEDIRGLKSQPKENHIILSLPEVLAKKPEVLRKLDPDSFARQFLRVFLTTPEDDKPNDYWIDIKEKDGALSGLLRVDNERSLYITVSCEHKTGLIMGKPSPGKTENTLKIKTIIYCMDDMGRTLSADVIERLLQTNIKMAFKRWLAKIVMWNTHSRAIFKEPGIMPMTSSSAMNAQHFKLALEHYRVNPYQVGVFHPTPNPLYEPESENLCLVVMPVPMDKFMAMYQSWCELKDYIYSQKQNGINPSGLEVLEALRPELYKCYHLNLRKDSQIKSVAPKDIQRLTKNLFDRFQQIAGPYYKARKGAIYGKSSQGYRTMMTSGLGEIMQEIDYQRILQNDPPEVGEVPADTAEWLLYTLQQYESTGVYKEGDDSLLISQVLLDRFQKILNTPLPVDEGVFDRLSQKKMTLYFNSILTELKSLSLSDQRKFRNYFWGDKENSHWNLNSLDNRKKDYLLRLFLYESAVSPNYPLRKLDTRFFKDILTEEALLALLKAYGSSLEKVIIVCAFDPYRISDFNMLINDCPKLQHLELIFSELDTQKTNSARRVKYYFPELKVLTISGYKQLQELNLHAPKLNRLSLQSLPHLEKGEMTLLQLQSLTLNDCIKMDTDAFEKCFILSAAPEQKMPVLTLTNTAIQKSFFMDVLVIQKSSALLTSSFTIGQWWALYFIFANSREGDTYVIALDQNICQKVQFLYPKTKKPLNDFSAALAHGIQLLCQVDPAIEYIDFNGEPVGIWLEEFPLVASLCFERTLNLQIRLFDKDKLICNYTQVCKNLYQDQFILDIKEISSNAELAIITLATFLRYNHQLKILNLCSNTLSILDAQWLLKSLKHNSTLVVLDLRVCGLTDDIAEEILSLLQKNSSLQFVNIDGNSFSEKIKDAILETLIARYQHNGKTPILSSYFSQMEQKQTAIIDFSTIQKHKHLEWTNIIFTLHQQHNAINIYWMKKRKASITTQIHNPTVINSHFNEIMLSEHSQDVLALIQLQDGRLASGSMDRSIIIWDIGLKKALFRLEQHSRPVSTITQLQDGRLASGSWDGSIILWNIYSQLPTNSFTANGRLITALKQFHNSNLASGHSNGKITLWDIDSGYSYEVDSNSSKHLASTVMQLQDGRIPIFSYHKIRLESHFTDSLLPTLNLNCPRVAFNNVTVIIQLKDGTLAAVHSYSGIILWNIYSGNPLLTLCAPIDYLNNTTQAHILRRDNRFMHAHSSEKSFLLYNESNTPQALTQLRDGRLASANYDGSIVFWDIYNEGKYTLIILPGSPHFVWTLIQLQDGSLASNRDEDIILWNIPGPIPTPPNIKNITLDLSLRSLLATYFQLQQKRQELSVALMPSTERTPALGDILKSLKSFVSGLIFNVYTINEVYFNVEKKIDHEKFSLTITCPNLELATNIYACLSALFYPRNSVTIFRERIAAAAQSPMPEFSASSSSTMPAFKSSSPSTTPVSLFFQPADVQMSNSSSAAAGNSAWPESIGISESTKGNTNPRKKFG